jgi:hypothetical protein
MEAILKNTAALLLAYTTHYAVTKAYNYVCVPNGVVGFISGLITVGSPVCQAGIQIMSNTQVSYSSMILVGVSRLFVDAVTPSKSIA